MVEGYGAGPPRVRGGGALLLIGAVALGLLGGAVWQRWDSRPVDSRPSSPIEWNAIQAVPTRAPDAEELAWEKRAESPSSGGAEVEAGSPPTSPTRGEARNDEGGRAVSGQHIYVIDGDTFAIGHERIRVAGIDAPETHPSRCAEEAQLGAAATQKLAELLRGGQLWISGSVTDRYGRSVRTVRVNGEDVAGPMIAAGLARNYDGRQRQRWC